MSARSALERVSPQDIAEHLAGRAKPDQYTRIELAASAAELVVLAIWLPGQFSAAHDHGGSSCTLRVLRGVATEQRFERVAKGRMRVAEEDRCVAGSILSCDAADIHALGNDAAGAEPLVTLHVYRPRPVMNPYIIEPGGGA